MSAAQPDIVQRMRLQVTRAIPTFLVSTATAVSFIGVFGTWSFLWPLISVAVLTHVLSSAVRSLRPPVLVGALAPPVIVYVCVGWLHFGETLRFGLPLSATWSALWSDLSSAWNLIGEVITPVEFDSGFGTMAMVVISFVAVASDAFATRYGGRVEVFVPAGATLFIVAAVGTGRDRIALSAMWMTTALFSTALIRRMHDHVRSARPMRAHRSGSSHWATSIRAAAGMFVFAGIVGGASALLAPLLPGSTDEAWITQQLEGESRTLQPLVDVRRQLTATSPSVLFTVRSDIPAYWRLTALPDFDGSVWTVSEGLLDSAAGELSDPLGTADPGIMTVSNLQRFTIEALAGSLIPVAATPTQLRSSTQSLFYEPETGSLLVGSGGLRALDAYDIQSTMLAPRSERLVVATSDSPPDDAYLELPDTDAMPELRVIASSIVSPDESPYQQALALQDFFRSEFTYTLDVPAMSDSDATLDFLERRSGYCEHFASTFAVFARSLGLPARVAIGFTPGDSATSDTGSSLFAVSTTHAHAWPEVWFDGIGWVLFEPTPGRGAPNASYTNVPEEQAQEVPPPTTLAPSTTTTAPDDSSSPTTSVPLGDASSGSADRTDSESTMWPFVLLAGVAALLFGWLFIVPRIIRSVIDRRSDPPILRLWRRAIALYELERGSLPRSLSPLELASRATSRLYDDDPFIFELAHLASRTLFEGSHDVDGGLPTPAIASGTTDSDSTGTGTTDGIENDVFERGRIYIRERRQRMSPRLRIRLRLDPVALWKLEGGSSHR